MLAVRENKLKTLIDFKEFGNQKASQTGLFVGLAFSPRELGGRVLMCPKGTEITLVCTEKQVKIFIPTLWLGGISLRLTTIFKKNKLIFVSLVILSGVIFFFLLNHHFFLRTARPILGQRNHLLGRMLESQLGQLFVFL